MNIKNRYSWAAGFIIGIFALQGNAAESWNLENNSVTYSVSVANIPLGSTETKVNLSKLNLTEVATQEGWGTGVDVALSSVVLSMNGVIVGSIYYWNRSAETVSPTFVVSGTSALRYGLDATSPESYSSSTPMGVIAPNGEYSEPNVSIAGSAAPKTVTITEGLERFLGAGTIETIAVFPVTGIFESGGTRFATEISLLGSADISITYNYVPEPSSVALLTMGFAALALRRKRKTV